jgi:hypothetical protein
MTTATAPRTRIRRNEPAPSAAPAGARSCTTHAVQSAMRGIRSEHFAAAARRSGAPDQARDAAPFVCG